MKVEKMIYIYMAICISMIAYNCVYVFILRYQEKQLDKSAKKYYRLIKEQIRYMDIGIAIHNDHKKYLCKKLKRTSNLTAFDKAMEIIFEDTPEKARAYLLEIYSVFTYLTMEYQGQNTIKTAYFPYILSKYRILENSETDIIVQIMFNLLRSDNVYCRENALSAIYSTGSSDYAVEALKIIDSNLSFHHPKLVCDGLLQYSGDKQLLSSKLWDCFNAYSTQMQVNILNFFRFANIRNDEKIYGILTDENANQELRFSCMRYFEKFPNEKARAILESFAENKENRIWEYQAIASSALKSYPGERTTAILENNLSSSNWYVRLNSAISCEKLGFTYNDLIQIFDGEDRYAREILRYRFDRREAQKEAVMA